MKTYVILQRQHPGYEYNEYSEAEVFELESLDYITTAEQFIAAKKQENPDYVVIAVIEGKRMQ